jgi:hypothetical protein
VDWELVNERNTGMVAPVWMVLAAAASAQSADACGTVEQTQSVSVRRSVGIDTSSGHLRLQQTHRQQGRALICMEAEQATVLRFAPSKYEMIESPTASGSRCVARVEHLMFRFEVRTPGRYTAWYRGSFPWPGHWNHREYMDRGLEQMVSDSRGQVLGKWIWTRGPTYTLTRGWHEWMFEPAWLGGALLDKVILSRKPTFVPEGLGPGASRLVSPRLAEATTAPVASDRVLRWQRLHVHQLLGRGSIRVMCSVDGARTWLPLPDGASLSALPPQSPLHFKLTLARDKHGRSPIVTGLTVTSRVPKNR